VTDRRTFVAIIAGTCLLEPLAVRAQQAEKVFRIGLLIPETDPTSAVRTAELEAVNKELASFSYSVSHDLRAPLRAIDGYARMLEEDYASRLDDEGRRLLSVVRSNSQRMGQLIDDLLAFSRLGRQSVTKHPVDMLALAHEVCKEVAVDARCSISIGALPGAPADAIDS